MTTVQQRVRHILDEVPPHVTVVAAAKGAGLEALREAVEAGISVVGHNHVSEARVTRAGIPSAVEWHYIGTLSQHAVRTSTLQLFDVLQTVDSLELAGKLDAVCARTNRRLRVFVEVNSGREPQKAGVMPEEAESLVRRLSHLEHLQVEGLMTMGPLSTSPEVYRACFARTFQLFRHLGSLALTRIRMEHLSMGMSDSYRVAIEEGATMIRLGTALFGSR